MSKILSK
jgi:Flagellar-associated PapD-like